MVKKSSNRRKKEHRRKPYETPTATKLTPEEAKLKLIEHASQGDEGVKDLLEMMFPEDARELSRGKKKSA